MMGVIISICWAVSLFHNSDTWLLSIENISTCSISKKLFIHGIRLEILYISSDAIVKAMGFLEPSNVFQCLHTEGSKMLLQKKPLNRLVLNRHVFHFDKQNYPDEFFDMGNILLIILYNYMFLTTCQVDRKGTCQTSYWLAYTQCSSQLAGGGLASHVIRYHSFINILDLHRLLYKISFSFQNVDVVQTCKV